LGRAGLISPSWFDALADADKLSPKQLAKKYGDEAARWASLQVDLRKKGLAKFINSNQMLFDREALEQATHEAIADYHASCFPVGVSVIDMTVGIGADLIGLAKRGPVVGFELDAMRTETARYNCPGADVRNEDGLAFCLSNDVPYIWADPDRRDSGGKRLIDPSTYLPNPLEIPRDRILTGIKLSPLLQDEYLESVGQRIEFVSYRGECREAIAWSGSQVEPGFFAVDAETREFLPRNEVDDAVHEPWGVIFDSDPAAGRAHALGNFGLPQLGDSPGYLTGETMVTSPWLRAYEVLFQDSSDLKRIKEFMRKNGLRVFEVKQRGAGVDPTTVMKQLKTEGDPVSLIAWRVEKSVRYAVVRRV
jgi:THUMP domain-like